MSGIGFDDSTLGEDPFNLDFTDAEDVSFTPAPEGTYTLRVEEARAKDASTGKKMINLGVVIQDEIEGAKGKWVWDNLVIPDRKTQTDEAYKTSMNYFCQKLEAITGEEWRGQQRKLNLKELPGSVFRAVVTTELYNDEPQNRIKRYLPRNAETPELKQGQQMQAGGFRI